MAEEIRMTDEEKALLDLAYTDGARILEGKLFDYQEKALRELRGCLTHLSVRDPQEEFKAISFKPSSKKGCVEMQFIRPGKDTTEYILKYEDGYYTDNFYDVPYEKEYDEIVENLLKKAGIEARVLTAFPFLVGDVFHSGVQLMNHRPHLGRHTALYFNADKLPTQQEAEAVTENVKKVFRENGIYSSGILFFVPNRDRPALKDIEALDRYCRDRANRGKVFQITFRCFQVNK